MVPAELPFFPDSEIVFITLGFQAFQLSQVDDCINFAFLIFNYELRIMIHRKFINLTIRNNFIILLTHHIRGEY